MRIRDRILRRIGPGAFSGVPLSVWFNVLRENRFAVDWPYWPRAALTTLASFPNSFVGGCEHLLYGRKIERTEIPPPIFVLGIWRSGTTHLHNLLSIDDRFAFPNFFQVVYPWTFLLTEWSNAWMVDLFLPKHRPQDNVKFATGEPQEDEFALCSLIGRSMLLSMALPRNQAFYDRYLTLRDLSPQELQQWKSAFVWFLKKLTYKHGRPLVLKSPGHTCRVDLLLELFPQARFVHIRRNPYQVFQSAQHTLEKATPWWILQRDTEDESLADQVLRQHKEVYDAYFTQREHIPAGQLHEISFEDLNQDPLGQIEEIYQALDLPSFEHVKPRLVEYVDSLAGYKKNVFDELPQSLRQRIRSEWQRCFDEWPYTE